MLLAVSFEATSNTYSFHMSFLTLWHTTANKNKTELLTSPIYFSVLPTLMHSNSVGSFQTLNEDYYPNSIVILKTPYTHHQIHNNNIILYINTLKKKTSFPLCCSRTGLHEQAALFINLKITQQRLHHS